MGFIRSTGGRTVWTKRKPVQRYQSAYQAWKKERNVYPGWYILPYNICAELSSKTREEGLLQSHTFVDLNRMFLFAYELAWRYEKCMHLYSDYEIHHLSIIWDNYYEKEIKSWSHESAIYETENIKKWFYIGHAVTTAQVSASNPYFARS